MKHVFYAAGAVIAAALIPTTAKAQDASWGCQVLLCAASSNPSWRGVPYCVPPMVKLINAMKRPGFSWPICHEAKAGRPGHERYDECPEGMIAVSSNDEHGRREQDTCMKRVNTCRQPFPRTISGDQLGGTYTGHYGGGRNEDCVQTISIPRPLRSDPWYFDIPNDKGVSERYWFNLRR